MTKLLIFDTGKSKHVIILVQTHQGQLSIHMILNKNATVEQLGSDECIPAHWRQMKTIQTATSVVSSCISKTSVLIRNQSKISQMKKLNLQKIVKDFIVHHAASAAVDCKCCNINTQYFSSTSLEHFKIYQNIKRLHGKL